MPVYDYVCIECRTGVEVIHGIHDPGPAICTVCGGRMRKALSVPAIVFRGSGWAKKDARTAAASRLSGGDGSDDGGDKEAGSAAPAGKGDNESGSAAPAGSGDKETGQQADASRRADSAKEASYGARGRDASDKRRKSTAKKAPAGSDH